MEEKTPGGWTMKSGKRCSSFKLAVLAIVGLFYSLQTAAVDYSITNLGAIGDVTSIATGINDNGQVVGYSEVEATNPQRPFIWQNNILAVWFWVDWAVRNHAET
ncbi:MAG: hypothetical protein AB1560_02310 [Pseudomonadota bacterium]